MSRHSVPKKGHHIRRPKLSSEDIAALVAGGLVLIAGGLAFIYYALNL